MRQPTTEECISTYLDLLVAREDLFPEPDAEGNIVILRDRESISQALRQISEHLERNYQPAEWARIGVVYRDQYLTVIRDPVRFASGRLGTYIRLMPPSGATPGVAILPVHQGKIVLLAHYRHATQNVHLEIPRGFGQPGADANQNAKRELNEELKAEIGDLISLGFMHTNTGLSNELVYLFLAHLTDLDPQASNDPDEGILRIEQVTPQELGRLITESHLTDSFTLAACIRAQLAHLIEL